MIRLRSVSFERGKQIPCAYPALATLRWRWSTQGSIKTTVAPLGCRSSAGRQRSGHREGIILGAKLVQAQSVAHCQRHYMNVLHVPQAAGHTGCFAKLGNQVFAGQL